MRDYQLAVIETISLFTITTLAHFLMGSQMQLDKEKKKLPYYILCEASTQLTKHA